MPVRYRRQPNDLPVDRVPPAPSRADAAEKVFTWGVFAYVVLRALPIWNGLQEGNVNPWIFLGLDLVTAYPYAKAWPRLFRSLAARRVDQSVLWAVVLLASLLTPYLYVAMVGDDVAGWVWVVLAVFLTLAVLGATHRIIGAAREARSRGHR